MVRFDVEPITDKRITSMLEGINLDLQRKFLVSARELASLVGKIISARSVFGNTS
jgi:hypothetical protein